MKGSAYFYVNAYSVNLRCAFSKRSEQCRCKLPQLRCNRRIISSNQEGTRLEISYPARLSQFAGGGCDIQRLKFPQPARARRERFQLIGRAEEIADRVQRHEKSGVGESAMDIILGSDSLSKARRLTIRTAQTARS